ncbi:NADPH-dependent ferric siderophore reductase, contains FAD-binding and SIP domains [Actinomyces ruminicola]|uniref:NADPH-dependent ferric siderophore reductase, contains FAD-binding and SIP domains n=1 Tax=Actinomyces ruminicola TaxID=332524 RepID=A0A1H0ALW1_9ACTO|nr:siderophore-interacting protein [Actinomyces ruminicola]SDN34415.1 NADPH-dependent ferric siderophore reductase, contains FAD-binding and SIP domains [Actinomyces ruminicola]
MSTAEGLAPFRFFPVRVERIVDVTPHLRRVTLVGNELDDFADPGWDQRIKLVLPAADGGYAHLPQGADWYERWRDLPAARRPVLRTYTTRAVRPVRDRGASTAGTSTGAEVDVDMVVHAPLGPASRWLESARPGASAMLLGPSRIWLSAQPTGTAPGGVDFVPPAVTGQFLIGGDETAAPAIARILEQLPASARGIAVVELPVAADAAYLPTHPGIELRALAREERPHGERLVAGVRRAAAELLPEGMPQRVEEVDIDRELLWEVPRTARGGAALKRADVYAWLAGEAGAVCALRRHLVSERGVDRRAVAFMGYWRLGRAEG